MLSYLELRPLTLALIATGVVVAIHLAHRSVSGAQPLLEWLALCLSAGGATLTMALLVCFATAAPIIAQEKIASAALLMGCVGGLLFASIYRRGGDGPPPPDDRPSGGPDEPGGDYAYPWWSDFERELRNYEAQGHSTRAVDSPRAERRLRDQPASQPKPEGHPACRPLEVVPDESAPATAPRTRRPKSTGGARERVAPGVPARTHGKSSGRRRR